MNVLTLVVRGWPLAYLGCYGNQWIATPTMDEFASAGVVFDNHIADAVEPSAIRRTWTTGRYHLPGRAGGGASLLDKLREAGVQTFLIDDADQPSAWEDTSGWGDVDRVQAEPGDDNALPVMLDAACSRLESLEPGGSPWLVWVELATLLPPWAPPSDYLEAYFTEQYDETEEGIERMLPALDPVTHITPGPMDSSDDDLFHRVQNTMAAAVSYVDAAIGELLTTASERGLMDDTVIVVMSDRGQALGERDVLGDAPPTLHEENVHVPLLVRLPKGEEASRRVLGLTQGVDIAPTLAAWLGVSLDEPVGHHLEPMMRGHTEEVRPFAVSARTNAEQTEWALRTQEWVLHKTIPSDEDDAVRLYGKPEDRWEVNDVRLHHLGDRDELEAMLDGFVGEGSPPRKHDS